MKHIISIENPAGKDCLESEKAIKVINYLLEQKSTHQQWNITVIFVDDKYITDLNARFLQKNQPTDVLAFNLSENKNMGQGEIYISCDTAKNNALFYNVPYKAELIRLIAHGTLHLLGYQDSSEKQKEKMRIMENKALEYIDLAC